MAQPSVNIGSGSSGSASSSISSLKARPSALWKKATIGLASVDEPDPIVISRQQLFGRRYRHCCLADAPRPDDADAAARRHPQRQRLDAVGASQDAHQRSGQIVPGRSLGQHGWPGRRAVHATDWRHEAVAAPHHVDDVLCSVLTVAERLA